MICCELCPRVYHTKCLEVSGDLPKDWVCPECEVCRKTERRNQKFGWGGGVFMDNAMCSQPMLSCIRQERSSKAVVLCRGEGVLKGYYPF